MLFSHEQYFRLLDVDNGLNNLLKDCFTKRTDAVFYHNLLLFRDFLKVLGAPTYKAKIETSYNEISECGFSIIRD